MADVWPFGFLRPDIRWCDIREISVKLLDDEVTTINMLKKKKYLPPYDASHTDTFYNGP